MSTRRSITQHDNRPEWVRFLEGYCGVQTYNRWRDWVDFITAGEKGLDEKPTDDELLDVVQFVSEREPVSGITSRKLAGWVKWFRKERRAEREGYSRETTEGQVDAVWSMMLRASDHAARWNLLCEGGPEPADSIGRWHLGGWDQNKCDQLQIRARAKWPDWDDAVKRIKARIRQAQVQAMTTIAENMEPVKMEAPF